mgnify:CR=1 FL=1
MQESSQVTAGLELPRLRASSMRCRLGHSSKSNSASLGSLMHSLIRITSAKGSGKGAGRFGGAGRTARARRHDAAWPTVGRAASSPRWRLPRAAPLLHTRDEGLQLFAREELSQSDGLRRAGNRQQRHEQEGQASHGDQRASTGLNVGQLTPSAGPLQPPRWRHAVVGMRGTAGLLACHTPARTLSNIAAAF